jgi:hypothetical protein
MFFPHCETPLFTSIMYRGASHHIYCNTCTINGYNNTHTW